MVLRKNLKYILAICLLLPILIYVLAPKERFYSLFSTETVGIIQDIAGGVKAIDIDKAVELERTGLIPYELSAVARITIWTYAWEMAKRYPLLGAGQSVCGDYVDNNYLRILAENGIFGLAAFILLIYFLYQNCIRVYNDAGMPEQLRSYALVLVLMLINILVLGLMVDVFEMSKIAFFFWLLVGVFFGAKDLYVREAKVLQRTAENV